MTGRGIDHIVLVGSDLGELAADYGRLGFTLTPVAQHPFGTGNQLAQLDGNFVELLALTRPELIPQAEPGVFNFAAYNRDFLQHGSGFSMIALKSRGWQEDQAHFEALGLQIYAPFAFSRQAGQPDGSEVTVGFRLTIAAHPDLPRAVFFTCDHQHEAKYFYKPQFQQHANTAQSLTEVMMVADTAKQLQEFFGALIGPEAVQSTADGISVEAAGSILSVCSRSALSERFLGADIGSFQDPRFVGYGIAVADIELAESRMRSHGLKPQRRGKSFWLCGPETQNVIIEFTETQVANAT